MTKYKAQARYRKNHPDRIREQNNSWAKRNPEKARERTNRWRIRNPEKIKASKKAWSKTSAGKKSQKESYRKQHENGRAFLNELKDNPCTDCKGTFHPVCMDFDHVRGEKIGNPGEMYVWSKEKLLAEIAKCELVCSNCHRIRTFLNRNNRSETHGTQVSDNGSKGQGFTVQAEGNRL